MLTWLIRSGKNPWEPLSAEQTARDNVIATNVGNMLFAQAVHRALETDEVSLESNRYATRPADAEQVNERYDGFVVPLANAFRLDALTGLHRLTRLIERLRIPVVVVGVGAQTSVDYDVVRLQPLDDAVRRFAAAVLDRSATIGVRGEFTADYLGRLGFRDVDVIGCPSMYLNGADLTVRHLDRFDHQTRLAITCTPHQPAMAPALAAHLAAYDDVIYVPQDIAMLRSLLWGDSPDSAAHPDGLPFHLSHPVFQQDRARFPIDPRTWLELLRQRDFSFGVRLHGTLAALLAGTPAVLLASDSRTLELARYHEIPHRLLRSGDTVPDAATLYAEADYTSTVGGHRGRFEHFLDFLEKNGLPHAYQPGRSTDAFDARVAAAEFAPPVHAPAPELHAVLPRLRAVEDERRAQVQHVVRLERELATTRRQLLSAQRDLHAARAQHSNPQLLRTLVGRVLRRGRRPRA